MTLILVLAYGGYKLTDLMDYNDYKLMKVEQENFYDMRDSFGSPDGFLLAAGVTDYSSSKEPVEDPEIGTIKLIKKTWDATNLDGGGALSFAEIPTRPCTAKDFFEKSDSSFFPTKKTSIGDIELQQRKFKCIDTGLAYELFGNYDTQTASNLMVVFEQCNKEKQKCKDDDFIAKWKSDKYIILYENIQRFIQQEFGPNRVERTAALKYFPLSVDVRTDTVFRMQRQKINMNDYRINVGSLQNDVVMGFDKFQAPSRVLTYRNDFWNSITYEMSLSQIVYTRTVYSFLDFLRDLGGLFSALGPFCGLIVTIFQYRGSYLRLMDDMGDKTQEKNSKKCCAVFRQNLRMRCPKKL